MSKAKLIGGVVVVLVILAVLWQMGLLSSVTGGDMYKAVFLSNGQVYFGKIQSEQGQYVKLREVFYLQVQQPVQPSSGDQPVQNIALIKLGDELHGPTDEMRLNRDHVLFIENMKDDAQIVQKITEFKESQASQ